MVLHAIHLAESYSRIIVRSDDTGVEVLLILCKQIHVWFISSVHACRPWNEREICPHQHVTICEKIGKDMSNCLPACRALTGCGTTSSLYRIGKTTAFTKLKTHLSELKDLAHFGLSASLEESLPVSREFALLLYGKKEN